MSAETYEFHARLLELTHRGWKLTIEKRGEGWWEVTGQRIGQPAQGTNGPSIQAAVQNAWEFFR